jgi:signal transduction histidine kinase
MVAFAFLIPLAFMVQELAEQRALAEAERQATVVVATLTVTENPVAVDRAIAVSGGRTVGRVAVHGLPAGAVGTQHARGDEIEAALKQTGSIVVDVPGGRSYLEPVDIGSGRAAVIEVFIPQAELSRGVSTAWYTLAALALGLVVVSVWVGDRLAAKVVGSARALGAAARSLGDGKLGVRVRPSGPRELVEAGQAFNAMADRVVALLKSERELIADLSHRLRTPMTALRLDAEALQGHAAERVRDSINALESEVDKIIRAARQPPMTTGEIVRLTQNGTPTAPRCDASEVVRERMVFWSAVAGDQGRVCKRIGASLPAPVPVARADLVAAVDALLGNVFRYTPQGTPVEVTVTRRDGWVAVRVDDGGPGIPDPDEALRRGVSNKGSTGLGLDIVHRLAAGARGAVNIGRSRLGGASVVVLLPDCDAPQPANVRFGLVSRLARDQVRRRPRD